MPTPDPEVIAPHEPASIGDTGLAESLVEQLIMKILYARGDLYGQDLSNAIGFRFSVIQDQVEALMLRHLVHVKRSLGVGNVAALLTLTEAGRDRAREYLEVNQYVGPAPVPMSQYADMVRRQRQSEGWLTKAALAKAFKRMVLNDRVYSQVGPAVSSFNSLLLYGKPGDGKTYLIESLANLDSAPIFLPHALECQGNIVQVYDPIYHQRIEEEQPSALTVSFERSFDRRWVKCKRPFIVSGGELALEMLDLRFNTTSRVYEAPFQLKANNGIYLIDDFGRQRATPAEVLNRWIVPMERRIDYLSFLSGGKMPVPFETFLVFSTNLNPAALGDEAFLRRIQYKMLMRGPDEREFIRIFEQFCASKNLPFAREVLTGFIDRHYRNNGKPFRRCHPRDVLTHAINLIRFERLPYVLTAEIIDRAFESCFLQEDEIESVAGLQRPLAPPPKCLSVQTPVSASGTAAPPPAATPQTDAAQIATAQTAAPELQPAAAPSCAVFWSERMAGISTVLGKLTFVASLRDPVVRHEHESSAGVRFGEMETAGTLMRLHRLAFTDWLNLNLERKQTDLIHFIASLYKRPDSPEECRQAIATMAPADAKPEETELFLHDLDALFHSLMTPQTQDPPEPVPPSSEEAENASTAAA
ncbi:MAG TPA: hypothetical protein VG675_05375 [Bryobacteraceae bacterium]|nr:hypothetical protein [Bryobacteraceae bacterium]